jgi:Xaa-Pro aminopeptidase
MLTMDDYPVAPDIAEMVEQRLEKARQLMAADGVSLLVIGPSADFRYFTGFHPHPSERLTALVIPRDGHPTIVVPRLEAPLLTAVPALFDLSIWTETENPIARIVELATAASVHTVAVNDELRAGFLLQLQEMAPALTYRRGMRIFSRLRQVKDVVELTLLREASRRTDDAWEEFCATTTLTGKSEMEVAARLRELMAAHGMPEVAFCIVASGPNGASPHHEAGDRVIQPGDSVVIDFGGPHQGYFSDITRTVVAGDPDPDFVTIYEIVRDAQQIAFEAIRPGTPCQEVDRAARRVIDERGYGEYFIHRTGHGIGLSEHEAPYLVAGNGDPLEPGMVVSDEPGIYIPGRWGIRIEDTVAVTATGAERLNYVSRELRSLT